MPCCSISDPVQWAQSTFGQVHLGDPRRRQRAVMVGAAMAARPAASLPKQTGGGAALKGAYTLLHSPGVTHEALLSAHWQQTKEEAGRHPLTLFPGDLSTLDYTAHSTTTGLGPIGNGKGRGYLVHSVLAVCPAPRQVLGLAHQIPYVPPPTQQETLRERQARRRQTDVWQEAVEAIGSPPAGVRWVHVGDRGSDIFRFLAACRAQSCDFLVRACKNRRVQEQEQSIDYLKPLVRSWPSQAQQGIQLPASHGKKARAATVAVTWGMIRLLPPQQEPADGPLTAWAIRVWEPAPPPGTPEPIEWLLLTSVAVQDATDAWERVTWYTCRWTNEDYHQCLKTGCRIEQRNLGDQPALERLLAFCAPVAIQLLQVRDAARIDPAHPATAVVEPEIVEVVAALTGTDASKLTIQGFWHAVARRGGWLGRKGDGPPGWKTLWSGWQEIAFILEGVRLARAPGISLTSG